MIMEMASFDIWIFGCLDIWMVINSLKIVIMMLAMINDNDEEYQWITGVGVGVGVIAFVVPNAGAETVDVLDFISRSL